MADEAASPDDAKLKELVALCLDRRERVGDAQIDDVCSEYPELRASVERRIELLERIGLAGAKHRKSGPLARTPAPSPSDSSSSSSSRREYPDRLGDFTLIRRIGGGGMGVVFLARQESLGREVALKLIRPENLYFGGAESRFRREVEAVARLNHPGIVPVYTVGEENGIPYFAMEHVAGKSLSDVVTALKTRKSAELSGRDLAVILLGSDGNAARDLGIRIGPNWIQACLKIALRTAEALRHAHERGVVHRDVKPSNILLARDGRAILVDFGLAVFGSDHSLTRSGNPLGSPPYMAPEVCASGGSAADERTDVYALAVTLYELLTLRMAYSGDSREIAAKILGGEHPTIRSLNPAVPWDVETVCEKAMDVDQDRRYPTAEAFALDLQNLLELRPIVAARPSRILRVRRFAQRKPAHAMAFLLAFFLTVIFPLGYSAALKTQSREIEYQRAIAESHRDAALDALGTIVRSLGGDDLPEDPRITGFRKEVLEQAGTIVSRLTERERQRRDVLARILPIEQGAAILAWQLGQNADVVTHADGALAILERLAGPDGRPDSERTAALLSLRAGALTAMARTDEANDSIRRSLAIFRELGSEPKPSHGVVRDHLQALGFATPLAMVRSDREFLKSIADEESALQSRALELYPEDPEFQLFKTIADARAGMAAAYEGRLDDARMKSIAASRALVEQRATGVAIDREREAGILFHLGEIAALTGDAKGAVEWSRQSVALYDEAVKRHPERPATCHAAARSRSSFAVHLVVLAKKGPTPDEASIAEAITVVEGAIVAFRALDKYLDQSTAAASDYAGLLGYFGDLLVDRGEFERASTYLLEAAKRGETQIARGPRMFSNRVNYAQTLEVLASAFVGLGRQDEAVAALERAWANLEETRGLGIADMALLDRFAATNRFARADLELARSRPAAAFAVVEQLAALTLEARNVLSALERLSRCVALADGVASEDRGADAGGPTAAACAALGITLLERVAGDAVAIERVRAATTLAPLRRIDAYRTREAALGN